MKMSMTGHMRMDQQMKLAPRMIQSMEVLQLPLLALQEKIEAELNSNPVLEQDEEQPDDGNQSTDPTGPAESTETAETLDNEFVVKDDSNNVEDFERLDNIGETESSFDDYMNRASSYRVASGSDDSDRKLQAMKNTAALDKSLHDHLTEQWQLVEVGDKVRQAGVLIIDYIDEKGYLTVKIEHLYNKDRHNFGIEHLRSALELIQNLEPTGVGARDLKECLLIQMAQSPEDMSFEVRLVADHLDELLENKLPRIAKKMRCTLDQINEAIAHMSKLDTSPGLQVGRNDNHPITADIILEPSEDGTDYTVSLADTRLPRLRVNSFYAKMSKNRKIDTKTREFLQQNIRSAQWFMDAIEQRQNTILRVAAAVVKHQKDFFDKGKLHLKPLPMSAVADEVGVHLTTISRAVAGKYIQCEQGILPLRGFFSGGRESPDGSSHSWNAVKAKLQEIVDAEDKTKPLNDDQIRKNLASAGLGKIARRTVAKYRQLLKIPSARHRKKY